MPDPILATLSDGDRFAYQSRRYGALNLWVMHLPSGKVILSTPSRDPIAIVNSFDDLLDLLRENKHTVDVRKWHQELAEEKTAKRQSEFDGIEINL